MMQVFKFFAEPNSICEGAAYIAASSPSEAVELYESVGRCSEVLKDNNLHTRALLCERLIFDGCKAEVIEDNIRFFDWFIESNVA